MNKHFWYVYILRCADNKPYTGYTKDLRDRLSRHSRGSVPSTKDRRPLKLETYFAFSDQYQAIQFEKYLKSGSGRAVMNKRFFKRT
ncbi:MAG: GIY-YIG nuclease family protein [Bacteroidota bacterium]